MSACGMANDELVPGWGWWWVWVKRTFAFGTDFSGGGRVICIPSGSGTVVRQTEEALGWSGCVGSDDRPLDSVGRYFLAVAAERLWDWCWDPLGVEGACWGATAGVPVGESPLGSSAPGLGCCTAGNGLSPDSASTGSGCCVVVGTLFPGSGCWVPLGVTGDGTSATRRGGGGGGRLSSCTNSALVRGVRIPAGGGGNGTSGTSATSPSVSGGSGMSATSSRTGTDWCWPPEARLLGGLNCTSGTMPARRAESSKRFPSPTGGCHRWSAPVVADRWSLLTSAGHILRASATLSLTSQSPSSSRSVSSSSSSKASSSWRASITLRTHLSGVVSNWNSIRMIPVYPGSMLTARASPADFPLRVTSKTLTLLPSSFNLFSGGAADVLDSAVLFSAASVQDAGLATWGVAMVSK